MSLTLNLGGFLMTLLITCVSLKGNTYWIASDREELIDDFLLEFDFTKELYEFLDLQLQSDLNEERMRHYEVVYLIHEKHSEEVETINQKVQAENAHYILMNFEIEAKYLNEFKGLLDGDETVIRHLVMKRDEAITENCPPPPEFRSVRAGMEDDEFDDDDDEEEEEFDEDGDNVEYEVGDDGNVVMVLYEDDGEEKEDGTNEPEQGQDQPNNGKRENRTTVNVGG